MKAATIGKMMTKAAIGTTNIFTFSAALGALQALMTPVQIIEITTRISANGKRPLEKNVLGSVGTTSRMFVTFETNRLEVKILMARPFVHFVKKTEPFLRRTLRNMA